MRTPALILSLTLLGAAALGHAQDSVAIMFPDAGEREVWAESGLPSAPPTDSVRTGAATVNFPLSGKSPTDVVFVWDKRNGNLASRRVKDVQSEGSWTVAAGDLKDVAQVKVRLEHSGRPLAGGQIEVNDGRRTQSQFLDPSTKGEVAFFDVKPGQVKIKASYRVKGGQTKSVTQLLDVALSRSEPIPSAVISVPEDVETLTGAAAATSKAPEADGDKPSTPEEGPKAEGSTEAPAPKGKVESVNPLGSILVYLIGLGIAAGIGYLLVRYMQQNKDLVEGKLKQLGVDIPPPGDAQAPLDPVAPIAPKKPDPPQKIILDDSAPDPLASAMPTPTPGPASAGIAAAPVSEPSLLSEAGDAMALPEGETVVGREVGLGLSLVGESTVSRRHAQLVRSGNEVTVTDLGSTNGTFVNGAKLQGTTTLRRGDTVQFGAIRFRYEA